MSLNSSQVDEISGLCDALWENTFTDQTLDQLQNLIRSDESARLIYLTCVEIHGGLYWESTGERKPRVDVRSIVPQQRQSDMNAVRGECDSPPVCGTRSFAFRDLKPSNRKVVFSSRWQRKLKVLTGLSSKAATVLFLLFICSIAVMVIMWIPERNKSPLSQPGYTPLGTDVAARLTDSHNARWRQNEDPSSGAAPREPTRWRAGQQLHLIAGIAEVTFSSGSRVLLEGPSILTVESVNAGRLEFGRLSGFVPPEAVGFALHTPQGTVIDRGTEFATEVAEEWTDVVVFSGQVEAIPRTSQQRRQLSTGELARIDRRGNLTTQSAEWMPSNRFVRAILSANDSEFESLLKLDFQSGEGNLASAVLAEGFVPFENESREIYQTRVGTLIVEVEGQGAYPEPSRLFNRPRLPEGWTGASAALYQDFLFKNNQNQFQQQNYAPPESLTVVFSGPAIQPNTTYYLTIHSYDASPDQGEHLVSISGGRGTRGSAPPITYRGGELPERPFHSSGRFISAADSKLTVVLTDTYSGATDTTGIRLNGLEIAKLSEEPAPHNLRKGQLEPYTKDSE